MKKALLLAALMMAAAVAFGALGDIVASFQVGSACAGLARSNGYLYSNYYSSPGTIYRVNADTGSIYGSFTGPSGGGNSRGLAYGWNSHLYVNKAYSAPYILYDINEASGSIYASYSTLPSYYSHGIAVRATGDGGSGTDALFISDYSADRMYVYSTTGSMTSSFAVTSTCTMYEIAYDWRNGLIWGAMNSPVTLHGVNTAGSIVSSVTVSGPTNSYGLTYHGQYLWAGTTGGWIYKIHCPLNTNAIAPSSLGRVKAIYK